MGRGEIGVRRFALGDSVRCMSAGAATVRIVVDDRENAGGVIGELRALAGVEVEVRRLDLGDYLVDTRFVVERKTLLDFAQSLIDGRLFSQAARLATLAQRGVIVLEGAIGQLQASRMSRESLQGALITMSVFHGLAILRAQNAAETARLLVYLAQQARRYANGVVPRPGYRPKRRRARQLYVLQGLPGVGPERAERLLERFGSVERVTCATVEELTDVPGIGETTAENIRWALGEP
jgi:ERCC4-type nuclease